MLARDGRTVWIREQTINVRNARTGVRLALGLMFDISEQMEEAQRAHVFAAVIESLADPVMILSPVLDGDGPELICVNPSFTRVTGYTAADLSKAPLATLLGAGASLVELEDLKRRLRFRRAVSQLMPTQHCNGEVFPCEWNVNGVADEQGEVIHYVAILRTAFEPEPARRKGLEIHSCVAAA
jgi:PAS domain S-box-containing protein